MSKQKAAPKKTEAPKAPGTRTEIPPRMLTKVVASSTKFAASNCEAPESWLAVTHFARLSYSASTRTKDS